MNDRSIYLPIHEFIGPFYTAIIRDFHRKIPFHKSIDLLDTQDLAKDSAFLFNQEPIHRNRFF